MLAEFIAAKTATATWLPRPSSLLQVAAQSLLLAAVAATAAAQGTAADYQRAKELTQRWRSLQRAERPEVRWLADGLWWQQRNAKGQREYVRWILGDSLQQKKATNLADLALPADADLLSPRRDAGRSGDSSRSTSITFDNRLSFTIRLFWVDREGAPKPYGELAPGEQRQLSTFAGHLWRGVDPGGATVGVFAAEAMPGRAVFDAAASEQAKARRSADRRPPSPFRVRDGNVYWRGAEGERALTTDGSADDPYHEPRHWSPDRRVALGFRVRPPQSHPVHLVESTPTEQLQPKLHTLEYLKPGDRIAESRPCLWDAERGSAIPVDPAPFANAWSIDRVHWRADGGEVYLLHNERGHQRLRVMAIDARTGAVRTVLEERSETFVDYSQKTILHWLDDRPEFLWASERDGWNHLYHVDAIHGTVRQVTRGEFVVRRIDHVDLALGQLWFAAHGLQPQQDPYHLHLARVDLDGGKLTVLTQADGDHEWSFAPDRQHFVASWSRIDHPWVTELRRAADGELVGQLARDDAAALLAAGFRPAERFVAKGRDGATDIHGILILPSNFDPSRRYPVIEDIYAGPHGQHVPKRWDLSLRQRLLAELGFAVVRIDGMGTNWRNKAFHDVCWRNLADAGFPDRIAWIRALASTRAFLDLERIGIFGGSAGGQNALAALLHHGNFYRVAVADCGCHDNRMDKLWWNEAWMGYPIGPWYEASSNVTHAGKLRGRLLLTVGELDRNVDPASTMQVVKALIDADKDFDLVVVPGGGHGVGETPYLVRRRQDFFVRHLLGVEPRRIGSG